MQQIAMSTILSAIICALLGPLVIPLLRTLKFGQSIRDEGPKWHAKKSGTPTMGGILFIVSSIAATVLMSLPDVFRSRQLIIIILTALGFGLVGFIDDFIKVVLKRNLGLTALQKFLLQLFIAVLSCAALNYFGIVSGELIIPFVSVTVDIGIWIVPFSVLVMLATVNSVNLTDGLDGLASSVTLVVGVFLTIVAFLRREYDIAVFAGAITGGCVGFLLFNAYPAKLFMGDTGSLFLGGAVSIVAIALELPLILIVIGGVYLVETLSVILQVTSFKLTGKRIFKMAPLHHHFEMCGLSERKIVLLFTAVTIVLCGIAYLGLYNIIW